MMKCRDAPGTTERVGDEFEPIKSRDSEAAIRSPAGSYAGTPT
jgi:hypothetical protein